MVIVYQQTDYQGFHIGENAEQSPGAFDVPAPVYDKKMERARFENGGWVIKTIAEWDVELNPPMSFADYQNKKYDELSTACRSNITKGFISSALGAPHTYDSMTEDQINLMGAKLAGIDLEYTCTDANGVKAKRLHTAAQIGQVFADGVQVVRACTTQYRTKKNAAMAAADETSLAAIVWEEI